jgi:hypothetical protein
MVDSYTGKSDKAYKSLSADSELTSGYEYLYKGDYKQCKRTIDKKLPKLKSDIDKFNFNILKIQLLYRTKRYKDAKNLIANVKKEVLTNQQIINSPNLVNFFKNVLMDLNDEQSASEILKSKLKNINLTKIGRTEQTKILKELCINSEFSEMYSIIANFLKNENSDAKFLGLLKYEMIYLLIFKYEKMSKIIASSTLKSDMLKNYEKLANEKGFIDILVKFLVSLNDHENFINIFENKIVPFTNAPIEDLLLDIYFQRNDSLKLVNYLVGSIKENLDKCNFTTYQRLVSYLVYYYKQTGQWEKLNIDSFVNVKDSDIDLNGVSLDGLDDIDKTFVLVKKLFNYIQTQRSQFNAYKSAIYAKLLLNHLAIASLSGSYDKLKGEIYELVLAILKECHSKQSLLLEVKKYFIYLDETMRAKALSDLYSGEQLTDEPTEEQKEKVVFRLKLEKLFNSKARALEELITYIKGLVDTYMKLTKGDIKLEKGERITGDDIIILINESFYEYLNLNPKREPSKDLLMLSYVLYVINSYSSSRSPYNYDISMYLLKICGLLNMNDKVLDTLKFMNIKGPQFETVAYIAFPYFFYSQFKPGLTYITESFERWEKDNKRSIRKTLWKMLTGRNFWNTEELLTFLNENSNSYNRYLIKITDLVASLSDNLLNPTTEEEGKESFNEWLEELNGLYTAYTASIKNNKIIKNQDLLVSIFKFKHVEFFNNNFQSLKKNSNYAKGNFKYLIDTIEKETAIYEEYPSYKNNYLNQTDVDVFGIFNDMKYLSLFAMNKLSYYSLSTNTAVNNKDLYEEYKQLTSTFSVNSHSQVDQFSFRLENYTQTLYELYNQFINNVDVISEDGLNKFYSDFKNDIIDSLLKVKLQYSNSDECINILAKKSYVEYLNIFTRQHLTSICLITSKLLDLINNNKKTLKDKAGNLKSTIINLFKSPLISLMDINIDLFETQFMVSKASEDLIKSLDILSENSREILISNENFMKEVSHKFVEEIKEFNKDIKDISRLIKNYIKDNI